MSSAHARCLELISQKDRQINELELELVAATARTTRLQRRLLLTLDALDALQVSHAEEMEAEAVLRTRMEEMLPRQTRLVQRLEADRDRLRDTVALLLKGVNALQDDDSHTYVHPPRPLDMPSHSPRGKEDERQVQAAMVQTLRAERDAEQAAHQRTLREAETIIASLKARLTSRDAEPEASFTGSVGLPTSASTPRHSARRSRRSTPIATKDPVPMNQFKARSPSPTLIQRVDDDTENSTLTGFDNELEVLNAKINEFTLERDNVVKMVSGRKRAGDTLTPTRLVIDNILRSPHPSPIPDRVPTPFARYRDFKSTLEFDDTDSGGEQPMELETPLSTASMLPGQYEDSLGRSFSPTSDASRLDLESSASVSTRRGGPVRGSYDDVFS